MKEILFDNYFEQNLQNFNKIYQIFIFKINQLYIGGIKFNLIVQTT